MSEINRTFFNQLVTEQKLLARRAAGFVVAYVLLSTTGYVLLDVYAFDRDSLYGLAGMIVWALGYILFVGLMQNGGLLCEGKKTGVGTYFALGIAIGIPVMLALVVFLIPGLYLLMRWLPSYSRALTTHDGVGNSMRWSWQRTERWQFPLATAMLFPILCYGFAVIAWVAYDYAYDSIGWTGYTLLSIVWNGAASIGSAWFAVLGVAAFKQISE